MINLFLKVVALVALSACAVKQSPMRKTTAPENSTVVEQSTIPAPDTFPARMGTVENQTEKAVEQKTVNATVIRKPTVAPQATEPASQPLEGPAPSNLPKKTNIQTPKPYSNLPPPLAINTAQRTGHLHHKDLTEVSGFSISKDWPGVIYAINDSGNSANLYAVSESGKYLGQWSIKGRNRDWEDLASTNLNGQNYVVIADTGDNLNIHKTSTLYFIPEPILESTATDALEPYMSVTFTYEDGPRNVEAFAIHNHTAYLISKEAVLASGPQASRLYSLDLPSTQPVTNLTARFLAELPVPRQSLEAKLAASFARVDLNHLTALDIDPNGRTAYLLSYRQIRRYDRLAEQTWAEAFQSSGTRIHTHQLGQAESLALAAGRAVFITSENRGAPIWAIPVNRYQ